VLVDALYFAPEDDLHLKGFPAIFRSFKKLEEGKHDVALCVANYLFDGKRIHAG
jgi:hypothetical protein